MKGATSRQLRRHCFALFALMAPLLGQGQVAPAGDGLKAEYFAGANFDQLLLVRRDATLAFDWAHNPPAAGVPAEYFSVRWTGWLVPPVSGRYRLHVTVDDGMRIWLNDRLILNEWRPQPVSRFVTSVELKAGEPYRLRVEYFQAILDTRAVVTWQRPDVPLAPPPSSWRNLWGFTAQVPAPKPIPTQFLFTRNPKPNPPLGRPLQPVLVVARPLPQRPRQPAVPSPRPAKPEPAAPVARAAAIPVSGAAVAPTPARPVALLVADSGSATQLTHLGVGATITLPELYFTQGKALLLPSARTALNRLAATLRGQPGLRFEVQGHTDNVGNAELNRQLSQQRAEAVCRYLEAQGAGAAQLQPLGYGGCQPVADNTDPAQRPRNRRVVLRRL